MSKAKSNRLVPKILIFGFSVFLTAGSLVYLANILFALLLFGLSVIFLTLWRSTVEGKTAIAQYQEALAAEKYALETLTHKMQCLSQNTGNLFLKKEVLYSLHALRQPDAAMMREVGLGLLRLYPLDAEVKQFVLIAANRTIASKQKPPKFRSQEIYHLYLELLEQRPKESEVKALVLEIGRWHFGKIRHGSLTAYDEQVIQNDIFVRSS